MINTAKELLKNGFQVIIYTTKALSDTSNEIIEGIQIRRFNYFIPWLFLSKSDKLELIKKGGNFFSFSMFFSLMLEKNIFIIHTHTLYRIGAIGSFISRLRKIPFVVTIHGGWSTIPKNQIKLMKKPTAGKLEWGKVLGWLLGSRDLLKKANAVICVGYDEYLKIKSSFLLGTVSYIPNGVNVKDFEEVSPYEFRIKYGISENRKIILTVARIDYQKNQLFLIKSLPEIISIIPEALIVLIGSITVDSYYRLILNQIESNSLHKHVLIIPGIPYSDILLRQAYAACDFFVLPSLHEPFGIVILEAWASKKPVITTSVNGVNGFTNHNKDCLHFIPNNLNDFLHQLNKLYIDTKLRDTIILNAFNNAFKNYSWETISNKILDLYNSSKSRLSAK